jgi:hypothetical protein
VSDDFDSTRRIEEQPKLEVEESGERQKNAGKICSVEGCENEAKSKGLCSKHYQRARYEREKNEDPESPPMLTSSDEPPRRRGRPPGKAGKSKSAKMPIPPYAVRAMGDAPFMLAGQVYAMRTGRNLDFTNPEQVAKMHEASLQALELWMQEAGLEAPAWLVYAGTTASCIGFAVAVDQMKMKMEMELANSLRAKPVNHVKPAGAGAGAAQPVR